MDFLQPASWAEALAARAARPDALPIAGGTDVMVELNAGRRPPALLDLTRVRVLRDWGMDGRLLRVGSGVSFRRLVDELGRPDRLPGLAVAARTLGAPQIRNQATIGGNLGSAAPDGDAHPPLLASGALVELGSVRGSRRVPVDRFFTGARRSVLAPDELIAAVLVPPATGPQQFAKVGARAALASALCSFALVLDPPGRRVGTGIGAAAPVPVPALAAEDFLATALDWDAELDPGVVDRFGDLVAGAAGPVDDGRATAAYRRHALCVLARRTLRWAWHDYRRAAHPDGERAGPAGR